MQHRIPRYAAALFFGAMCVAIAVAAPGSWLDVPYVKQPRDGCGAACISMVLQYWIRKDPQFHCNAPSVQSIQRTLYSPQAHGIFARDMASYLRQQGLRVFTLPGNWNTLEEHLAKGRPLIVCLREGRGLDRTLHYVVVVGIDPVRRLVLVNDPAGKKLDIIHQASFEKKWRGENYWTLLAVPRP